MNNEIKEEKQVEVDYKNMTLDEVLVLMQIELLNPKADTEAYNYKYATLPTILSENKPVLRKYGCVIIQTISHKTSERPSILKTELKHGKESIVSTIEIPDFGMEVQKLGSYITYIRRYSILLMLGISAEDDDGELTKDIKPKVGKTIQKGIGINAKKINPDLIKKEALERLKKDIGLAKTVGDLTSLEARIEKAKKLFKNYELSAINKLYDTKSNEITESINKETDVNLTGKEIDEAFKDL